MGQRVGLVLAGGSGRRLGRTKGDLRLGGRTLAQRAAEALFPHCGSVLISVAQGADNPAPEWPAVEDWPPPGRGPLAGIAAAFASTSEADLLVLACDYPRVGAEFAGRIARTPMDGVDLAMPTDERGIDHPLVALWSRRLQPLVDDALADGRFRVQSLLPDCRVQRLGPDRLGIATASETLANLNFATDLDAFGFDPEG